MAEETKKSKKQESSKPEAPEDKLKKEIKELSGTVESSLPGNMYPLW